jgi:hypothetical protein
VNALKSPTIDFMARRSSASTGKGAFFSRKRTV